MSDSFFVAFDLDKENKTASRIYRYSRSMVEKKKADGTWEKDDPRLCIFKSREWNCDIISREEADSLEVRE